MILSLQTFTDEMERTSTPTSYKQAHKDLQHSYQNFLDALTVYQKAINKEGITTSNIMGVITAYPQITQASEEWYTIYKERLAFQKNLANSQFTALGNLQDQRLYSIETLSRNNGTLESIRSNLLPWVDKKDYSGVEKIQSNLVHTLPSFIFYMNIIKVPEPYSIAHQNLLSTYENFYNLIKDTKFQQINDEYLEKLRGSYEDIKKASEEWDLVLEQQS
ncbi:hypothetical protein [Neobacillus vireti]|uniref:Uncharacterized protein n=1 Tax=Neobacillus vireti LMG 21834 TaxID=1131730 RepID=A0AB94IFT4_9BACI|nr:hypothetical protein [Neobacillus vireti]ETI65972.1 hypothetical protein BAVI_24970 [Neobacillus vireti LMG 21834]KLT17520.1 hypothetical protein AA980_12950 [Neobacillus vireti]